MRSTVSTSGNDDLFAHQVRLFAAYEKKLSQYSGMNTYPLVELGVLNEIRKMGRIPAKTATFVIERYHLVTSMLIKQAMAHNLVSDESTFEKIAFLMSCGNDIQVEGFHYLFLEVLHKCPQLLGKHGDFLISKVLDSCDEELFFLVLAKIKIAKDSPLVESFFRYLDTSFALYDKPAESGVLVWRIQSAINTCQHTLKENIPLKEYVVSEIKLAFSLFYGFDAWGAYTNI